MRTSELGRLHSRQASLERASGNMQKIQQQLSTGRKITVASDDAAGSALALGHRRNINFENQMRRNLETGRAVLNAGEAALGSGTDLLQRARELTVNAASGTLSQSDRIVVALEIDQIIAGLAQLGNTQFGGAYLFSGHQSNAPAYAVTGNPPTAVTYQGDAGQRLRRVSEQDTVAVNVPGVEAFASIFDDLIALRDDLNGAAPASAINAHLTTIDDGLERMIAARAAMGARSNRFETAQSVSEQRNVGLQELRSSIEEIDLPSTIVEFTAAQNALQAALGAIGRTSGMTLLDFLR